MQAVSFPARQTRTHYRHELRTLTYVTLDEANGGIIRNLSHDGVAVQAVAPLRQEQRVRLRFELRFPRLRVEAYGQVSWSNLSGQCGVRFVQLPARTRHQIDEWIFSNLLDSLSREDASPRSIFGSSGFLMASEEDDGLILSAPPRAAIRLAPSTAKSNPAPPFRERAQDLVDAAYAQLNWLSRPLSARTLAWMVDSLVMIAAMLMFALIFLSIAHELPRWPLTLSAALGAAVFVAATYWSLFAVFGGPTLGARLTQAAAGFEENQENGGVGRFR
ncbi:MAG: PilZ domain-containing protein [Candidatus Sulfotelmatobacter sp.]